LALPPSSIDLVELVGKEVPCILNRLQLFASQVCAPGSSGGTSTFIFFIVFV
jgi:hypothetical protein